MPKAEYKNALRSRHLIQQALAELLHEKSLEKITVSDVVRRAGINRSTFYAHYADIPAVLNRLVEQTFTDIREQIRCEPRLEDAPKNMLKRIQRMLEADLEFYRIVMTSCAASMVQERIATVVLEFLSAHPEVTSANNYTEYEIPLVYCTGGLIRLYQSWFAGKLSIPLDTLTEQATEMILRTITPR